jgi:hypothetical protein
MRPRTKYIFITIRLQSVRSIYNQTYSQKSAKLSFRPREEVEFPSDWLAALAKMGATLQSANLPPVDILRTFYSLKEFPDY